MSSDGASGSASNDVGSSPKRLLSIAMGGKRYLSGYIDFTAEGWREHFGDRFEKFAALKKKHDPQGRLNPGFVKFGPPPQ